MLLNDQPTARGQERVDLTGYRVAPLARHMKEQGRGGGTVTGLAPQGVQIKFAGDFRGEHDGAQPALRAGLDEHALEGVQAFDRRAGRRRVQQRARRRPGSGRQIHQPPGVGVRPARLSASVVAARRRWAWKPGFNDTNRSWSRAPLSKARLVVT